MTGSAAQGQRITVRDVIQRMERIAPTELAMDGDPIGLQIGNPDRPVSRIMVALDAYPDVIHEAVTTGVDLLITHHAMLFRPIRRIDTSTSRGRALAIALAHDLAVYSAHTNLDIAEGGVNDVLAQRIGLVDVRILDRTWNDGLRKLVVFVPVDAHDGVLQAICSAGGGTMGHYSHSTFNVAGVGTFLPHVGANPTIGSVGRLEKVNEIRIETIVPSSRLPHVIRAMLDAHPYEEVAYDVYPLDIVGRPFGLGRIGDLPEPMPLAVFANEVKDRLGLTHVRFGGSPTVKVQRVAVLGGAGGKWVSKAIGQGADVLVTSDVDHHTVAEAWHDGLAVVDATHAALETPVLDVLAHELRTAFAPAGVAVMTTSVVEDPFTWV